MKPSQANPYQAYNRATHTVAKTRQVVMLYDGAIRFLAQARDAMEQGEIERRYKTLTRAGEILIGLQSCLDFEAGADAAQTLYDFYSALDGRIMQLHRTGDSAACAQVIEDLRAMRAVWHALDNEEKPQNPPAAPQAQADATVPAARNPVTVSA